MIKRVSFVVLLLGVFCSLLVLSQACGKGGPTGPGLLLVKKIVVNPSSCRSFTVGETITLIATVYMSDGTITQITDGTWSSDNPNVATVDSNGLVTMVGGGMASIVMTYRGVAGSLQIIVTGTPISVFGGTWTGTYSIEGCNSSGDFLTAGFCDAHTGSGYPIELTLTQDQAEVFGTVALGGLSGTLGPVILGWMWGSISSDPYSITIETDFQSPEPGKITGTFYLVYTAANSTGSGELTCKITSLRRSDP